MACERCKVGEEILLPCGSHKFCRGHFLEFFEKRFRKTRVKYRLVSGSDKIRAGVFGGKDSSCAAYLLHNTFPRGSTSAR